MGMDTLASDGAAPTAALPDEEIVRRVRAGDSAVFEILMRRHNQRVYRVVRAVVKDEVDVEDVMQQATNRRAASGRRVSYRASAGSAATLVRITSRTNRISNRSTAYSRLK
jgi:RNA polymerase sigma-70 factor, ECF subfamily